MYNDNMTKRQITKAVAGEIAFALFMGWYFLTLAWARDNDEK